jgi:hypothetical protein
LNNPERVIAAEKAIRAGDSKRLRLYLKAGLSPNTVLYPETFGGRSLLCVAAQWGQLECAKVLIEGGADHLFESGLGGVLGNCLANTPSMELFRYLLDNFQFSSDLLGQALLQAASLVDPSFVNLLIAVGADPNFDKDNGCTPLVYAVQTGREDNAMTLLAMGAKVDLRIPLQEENDFSRMTIREAAAKQNMSRLLSLLQGDNTAPPAAASGPRSFEESLQTIRSYVKGLPGPCENIVKTSPYDSPACADYMRFLTHHNGSGQIDLLPMASEPSYTLLSLEDSVGIRSDMMEISFSENTGADEPWWSASMVPIGTNGAGDLLTIDSDNGQVLYFNHETHEVKQLFTSFADLMGDIDGGLRSGKYAFDAALRAIV